jgi:NAD(P)-dependent dehydrogenase (short-subunit alcohol dehydrogenase family)
VSGRLSGRVAIVTGGARGVGAAIAERFRAEGAATFAFDLSAQDSVSDDGKASVVGGDVTNDEDIARLVNTAMERFGRIDILVNNAAILQPLTTMSFRDIDLDAWDAILRVNLRGAYQMARAIVPVMEAQGYGRIINIGSSTAFFGAPIAPYAASKAGLVAFAYTLARELGPSGITANTIALGLVDGPSLEEQPPEAVAGAKAFLMGMRAVKQDQGPESVADAAVFLSSEESRFITGQTLFVDGGAIMH